MCQVTSPVPRLNYWLSWNRERSGMGGQQASVLPAEAAGRANLALIYQEILTAITRFRSNRQAVADAGSFRNQIKAAIGAAESEATRKGYAPDDVRLATFAVVAFLDESILNSNNPIFADWPRMPLQRSEEHTSELQI